MNNSELTDMVQVYFECGKKSYAAARLYRERFPNRETPKQQKFARLEYNLRTYGSFKKQKSTERKFRNEALELDVLLNIEENPRTSLREISQNVNASHATVQAILKKYKFKPYVAHRVHSLEENDRVRRLQFCHFYLNKLRTEPDFFRNIMWTDECSFNNNGLFNRNIHRIWSQENPRFIVANNFQRRFTLNVWCGMLGDMVVGPIFIDGHLNQQKYYQLLTENVQSFLDEMPLAQLNSVYFQQDGAAPHNARINVEFLNREFDAKWMGTNGPIQWPARSPDLTPLDFFLWDYIQDRVYLTPPDNIEILRERIANVCRELPGQMLLNASFHVARRCQLCIDNNGGHFEQFL